MEIKVCINSMVALYTVENQFLFMVCTASVTSFILTSICTLALLSLILLHLFCLWVWMLVMLVCVFYCAATEDAKMLFIGTELLFYSVPFCSILYNSLCKKCCMKCNFNALPLISLRRAWSARVFWWYPHKCQNQRLLSKCDVYCIITYLSVLTVCWSMYN